MSTLKKEVVKSPLLLDCIVAYYNGTDVDFSRAEEEPVLFVRDPRFRDYKSFNGLSRLAAVLMLEGRGRFSVGEAPRIGRRRLSVSAIADELRKHRTNFCAAVKWLCTEKQEPKSRRWLTAWAASDFRGEPPDTFRDMRESDRLGRYPDIDETSEKFVRYFETHGLQHIRRRVWMPDGRRMFVHATCNHWVDLFCTFLLSECSGRPPKRMPIKLCRQCEKVFSSTRSDTQFCPGGECTRKSFWNEERHSDYEFVRRHMKFAENCVRPQSGYSLDDLRNKLEKPRVKKRMQAIRQRWKGWPRILVMISNTEKLAVGSKRSKV